MFLYANRTMCIFFLFATFLYTNIFSIFAVTKPPLVTATATRSYFIMIGKCSMICLLVLHYTCYNPVGYVDYIKKNKDVY